MLRNWECLFNFITSAFGGEFHYTNILLHSEKTHTHTHTQMEISKTTVFSADGIRTMFILSYMLH